MTPSQIAALAGQIYTAEITRTKCGLPTAAYPAMSLAEAYATQEAFVGRRIGADGVVPIGWKVGFTSAAIQQQMRTEAPGAGIILSDMLWANGIEVALDRLVEPRVEAEIAFVMKSALKGSDVGLEEVLEATESVAPALEILTSRIVPSDPATGKSRSALDAIASNIACAGIVLGEPRAPSAAGDLRHIETAVSTNGPIVARGVGTDVLGDPRAAVLWLVHHLAESGRGLAAGEIVMSGSLITPLAISSRCSIVADFGSFGAVRATLG